MAFDFGRVNARCESCECDLQIHMQPVAIQFLDATEGSTEPEIGVPRPVLFQWWRLPRRIRWLITLYAAVILYPVFVIESFDEWQLWIFAAHYSLAAMLGFWAAGSPRFFIVERCILAALAILMLDLLVAWLGHR